MTTILLAVACAVALFTLPGATIGAAIGFWIFGPVGAVICGLLGLVFGDAP